MKLLLALTLFVFTTVDGFLVFGGDTPAFQPKLKYQTNEKYVYRYESQVMTGIPSLSKQYSSVKLVCDVNFNFISSQNVEMQLTDIKVYEMNEEIKDEKFLPPYQQLPVDRFKQLPEEDLQKINSKLALALKFSMGNDNKVTALEVASGETNWSVNIKRAIIALMQVTVTPSDDSKNVFKSQLECTNYTRFELQEDSIDGTCWSVYDVYKSTESAQYRVIKTRDYERCLRRNMVRDFLWTQKQSDCKCDDNMISQPCTCETTRSKPSVDEKTQTDYSLMLNENNQTLIIKNLTQRMENKIYRNNRFESTYSHQILTYIKKINGLTQRGSQFKSIDKPWRLEILTQDEEVPMMTPTEIRTTALSVLNELAVVYRTPERYSDQMMLLYQLMDLLKLMNTQQLTQLFSEIPNQEDIKMRYLLDGMVAANATKCDKFILNKIKISNPSNRISDKNSIIALMHWTAHKVPTVELLETFMTVVPLIESARSKEVYKQSMLCFSAMITRHRNSEHFLLQHSVTADDKKFHTDRIDDLQKFEKFFTNKLQNIPTTGQLTRQQETEVILLMKCLQNIASIRTLPSIQPYMKWTQNWVVRIHAMYALHHFAVWNKMEVLKTITPVFYNQSEHREVRMGAFIVMLKCNPVTELSVLPETFDGWVDVELKSFVVKHLETTVKKSESGFEERDAKIRMILARLRPFRMSDITNYYSYNFGHVHRLHHSVRISYLGNETSRLPQAFSFKYQENFNNRTQNYFEVGYRSDGIENLFTPDKSNNTEEPAITLFAKFMDQHVAFYHLDSRTLKQIWNKAQESPVTIPIKVFTAFLPVPEYLKVLTVCGYTSEHKLIRNHVLDVEGQLTVKINNGLPEFNLELTKARIDTKSLNVRFMNTGFRQFGVTHGYWAGNRLNIGQKAVVNYNMRTNQLTVQQRNPTTDKKMYAFDLHQYSTIFSAEYNLPRLVSAMTENFKPIKQEEPERKRFSINVPWLRSIGMDMKVEGDVSFPSWFSIIRNGKFNDWNEYLPQDVRLSIRPVYHPAVYEIKYTLIKDICSKKNHPYRQPTFDITTTVKPKMNFMEKFLSRFTGNRIEADQAEGEMYLESSSLASVCNRHVFAFSSVHNNVNRTSTCNITQHYEHDHPDTHTHISMRLPADSTEPSDYMINVDMKTLLNPQTSEVVYKWDWSSGFNAETSSIVNISAVRRPVYKDGFCNQAFIYGCKDKFGVVTPQWYNMTSYIQWKNTMVPSYMEQILKYKLINDAPMVFITPMPYQTDHKQIEQNSHNQAMWSFIEKPYQQQLDVWTKNDTHSMIFNNTHSFIYFNFLSTPTDRIRFSDRLQSIKADHHYRTPFQTMKKCMVRETKLSTYNDKTVHLPQTDCEVYLASDCDRREAVVSYQHPNSGNKKIKIKLGSTEIEVQLTPGNFFSSPQLKLRIDREWKDVVEMDEVVTNPSNRSETICEIRCTKADCEIKSNKYGIKVIKISHEDVQLMVDETNPLAPVCGLCKYDDQSNPSTEQLKQLIQENKPSSQNCNLPAIIPKPKCTELIKRQVFDTLYQDRIVRCVSTDKLKLCPPTCQHENTEHVDIWAKCVPWEVAEFEYNLHTKIYSGKKILRDESSYNNMPYELLVKIPVRIVRSCQ